MVTIGPTVMAGGLLLTWGASWSPATGASAVVRVHSQCWGGTACFSRRSVYSLCTARIPPFEDRTSAVLHAHICSSAHEWDGAMEITTHQHLIERCVTMACSSRAAGDKVLWLNMAQSWVRLADEVARAEHIANGRQQRH